MKRAFSCIGAILFFLSLSPAARAREAVRADEREAAAPKCPVCGKDAIPTCTSDYEGESYAFATADCRKKWNAERRASLYHQIGGKAAISAAVELFYTKVLADESVNAFFDDVNMNRQRNKQRAFLSAALGGPIPWTGKDLRKAHSSLGLKEEHFGAIAGHLQATLTELKVGQELIDQVMEVIGSTRDEVLDRNESGE